MTKQWPDITLFCRHGVKDGEATFLERFRHIDDSWVPTALGRDHSDQLQSNTAITITTHQAAGGAIRQRYAIECPVCKRPLRKRYEEFQQQLYMASHVGFDTLYLDLIT